MMFDYRIVHQVAALPEQGLGPIYCLTVIYDAFRIMVQIPPSNTRCHTVGASIVVLTFRDITTSRQSKRVSSALDFRNVGVPLFGEHQIG